MSDSALAEYEAKVEMLAAAIYGSGYDAMGEPMREGWRTRARRALAVLGEEEPREERPTQEMLYETYGNGNVTAAIDDRRREHMRRAWQVDPYRPVVEAAAEWVNACPDEPYSERLRGIHNAVKDAGLYDPS